MLNVRIPLPLLYPANVELNTPNDCTVDCTFMYVLSVGRICAGIVRNAW